MVWVKELLRWTIDCVYGVSQKVASLVGVSGRIVSWMGDCLCRWCAVLFLSAVSWKNRKGEKWWVVKRDGTGIGPRNGVGILLESAQIKWHVGPEGKKYVKLLAAFSSLHIKGWAQDYGNSNIFLKPLFRGNLDPFVNNANLGAIAHTSNGT